MKLRRVTSTISTAIVATAAAFRWQQSHAWTTTRTTMTPRRSTIMIASSKMMSSVVGNNSNNNNRWGSSSSSSSRIIDSGSTKPASSNRIASFVLPSSTTTALLLSSAAAAEAVTTTTSSTTAASEEEEQEIVSSSIFKPMGNPIAFGSVVSKFKGGMSAVCVLNDGATTTTVPSSSSPQASSQTVMNAPSLKAAAAAAAKTVAAAATGTASSDLQGHHVVFSDGSVGMVVAHRPPLVFVYSIDDDSGRDDKKTSSSKTNCNDDDIVQIFASVASVSVSSSFNVVDCFGRPQERMQSSLEDNRVTTTTQERLMTEQQQQRPILAPIPQVKDISLINHPMITGISMMDVLTPIGRGQNMLMIGHDLNDMRGYVLDFVQSQIGVGGGGRRRRSGDDGGGGSTMKCVYASSERDGHATSRLSDMGIADDIHLVAPGVHFHEKDEISQAAEIVTMAGTACAIAESYAMKGMDTLVVIDSIDALKTFWDATTRSLVDVFGAEAVVQGDRNGGASSEMRAFYSALIQRAAQYNKGKGGGSVTLLLLTTIPRTSDAGDDDDGVIFEESDFENTSDKVKDRIKLLVQRKIPLTATNLRKIEIPIPSESEGRRRFALQHIDDLISMSDGQIWLDERLEQHGQRPPLDPQRSITRIGIGADTESRADAPALRRIAEGLRLDLLQAASMDGAESTNASVKQSRRQKAVLLAMFQRAGSGGRRLSQTCVALLAASEGHLDDAIDGGAVAGTVQGETVMERLLRHVEVSLPRAMEEIDQSLDISETTKADISAAISLFFQLLEDNR